MRLFKYTALVDTDLLRLVDQIAEFQRQKTIHKIETQLFKIVQRTDTGDYVAIIEEKRT